MASEKMVNLSDALDAVRDALESLDMVTGPDLSDAEVVGEAIKKHGHSLDDMGIDVEDVVDMDNLAENIDLDRVMGNHSCADLTEALCEYHGTSDVLSEIQSNMGRADWREHIVDEAIHELGYSDQIDLVGRLFKQDGFDARIAETLEGHGWVKEEERADPAVPGSYEEAVARAKVAADTIPSFPLLEALLNRDGIDWVLASVKKWAAENGHEPIGFDPADRDSDKARIAVEAIPAPYLVTAVCNDMGHKRVVEVVKAWGVEQGIDPFADLRAEIEAEVKRKFAERLMSCLFGA